MYISVDDHALTLIIIDQDLLRGDKTIFGEGGGRADCPPFFPLKTIVCVYIYYYICYCEIHM